MYLKIRDLHNKCWEYIYNFDRLSVDDIRRVGTAGEDSSKDLFAACVAEETNLSIIDPEFAPLGNYMKITCVTESKGDDNGREFSLVFNTYAFLCSERGHTMDRFIVNRD